MPENADPMSALRRIAEGDLSAERARDVARAALRASLAPDSRSLDVERDNAPEPVDE